MTRIHPSALVDPSSDLGEDVTVGPHAIIEEHVVIGSDCSIAAHAVVKRHTRMGRRNRVHEHAVIGGDPQDYKFKPCASRLEIGDDNIIREGVTIHRGSNEETTTRIGDGNFLMANCHVAHDCQLGNQIVIANGALLGGVVAVQDRAFISGAVTIHQFCRVGRLAMVAGSARIVQDCLPFVITDGVPGRARGLNTVGLRRAGMDAAEMQELKRAFRVLCCAGMILKEALAELATYSAPSVGELKRFIETSTRGFAHCR
jgi:UDP-N-acetylglucosamine acyltransferase